MRWIRMLSLYFERTFEYRLRSLLWLMLPMINNMTLILFWTGAGMGSSALSTYYILMTIGGLLTTSHVEYEVSEIDIKQGQLVNYLTKPISYYWMNLLNEIPYRVLQMIYATTIIGFFLLFFPRALSITLNMLYFPLVILIFTLGYLLSFTFKMSLSYLAFWFKDIHGLMELVTIVIIIMSGGIMPLPWYPQTLQTISNILPFAYSGYYPVVSLQGVLSLNQMITVITVQGIWLSILLLIHNALWSRGVKEFTAVGQ
ncbi:MAG: ABC-2 family transporter protein [Candidatus Roizmanbacteria bacterium]|nr:ABC-2 family transporter protein [Candidatus Roizmanbacteria bacterium]